MGQIEVWRAITLNQTFIDVNPFAIVSHHRIDIDLDTRVEGNHPRQPVGQNMALRNVTQVTDNDGPRAAHDFTGDQIFQKTTKPFAGDRSPVRRAVIGRATKQHARYLQHLQVFLQQRAVGNAIPHATVDHLRLNGDHINGWWPQFRALLHVDFLGSLLFKRNGRQR
ncbi:hypothetical protein D3C75_1009510 [compost metagenome]